MLIKVELVINGKVNSCKHVGSWAECDKQIESFKNYLTTVIDRRDTWEIAIMIKSDFKSKKRINF